MVITGRRAEKGEQLAKDIKAAGGEASFYKCDVSKPAEVKASIDFTVEKYGSIDLTFNNAGTAMPGDYGPPHTVPDGDWAKTTQVNLDGVFYSAKYQVAKMLELGVKEASIVNCASIYSFHATPVAAGKS